MTPWQAIILGLVEGITEFLPVSSTGHLILTSWLLGMGKTPESKDAIDAFEIIIQAGAILAVAGLYRADLVRMVRGVFWRVSSKGRMGFQRDAGWVLMRNIVVAFLPALVLGALFGSGLKRALFHPWPVITALAAGGVLMLVFLPWQKRQLGLASAGLPPRTTLATMTIPQAFTIGVLQCVALFPGTSRSLMTLLGGLAVGLRAVEAAKFSFLLGLVTLLAASTKETLDIVKGDANANFLELIGGWVPLLLGILAAWASAALAVDLFVSFLSRHTLAVFGWWRLLLAATCATILLLSAQPPTIAP